MLLNALAYIVVWAWIYISVKQWRIKGKGGIKCRNAVLFFFSFFYLQNLLVTAVKLSIIKSKYIDLLRTFKI